MGWQYLGILFAVALALSVVGFYKYVYFMSVGYGFAIAGVGVSVLIMFAGHLSAAGAVICVLLIAYGARLSGFLIYREAKSAAYRRTFKAAVSAQDKMNYGIKFAIWISVALLYVAQTAPAFYIGYNAVRAGAMQWTGTAVGAAALVLETVADIQKSAQKAARPDMVAMKGLYGIVRCPNYFAEILFWTGVLLTGIGALRGIGQWSVALTGYVCIVLVMFNGAQRLEKGQNARYGSLPEYRDYANGTPIILPLVPLYHLNRGKKQ